ncbi:MAG: hypothetical protein DRN12_07935 [Thermoplasmata archaeon]|nr:MAG: hypothetical protein DRN12_07935 [Thermoplasmata archaeon]
MKLIIDMIRPTKEKKEFKAFIPYSNRLRSCRPIKMTAPDIKPAKIILVGLSILLFTCTIIDVYLKEFTVKKRNINFT